MIPANHTHGFTFEWEYASSNRKTIKCVVPSTMPKKYVSIDQKSMRLWDPTRDYEVLNLEKDHFIRVVLPIPGRRIYLAAALDMKFKVYDANLLLVGQFAGINPPNDGASTNKSTSKEGGQKILRQGGRVGRSNDDSNSEKNSESIRAVLCMKYDTVHDEIITGGLSGCQRWRLSGDRFHQFVFSHLQTLPNSQGHWIDHLCLANAAKLLFCCHGDSVTVYSYEYLEGVRGGNNNGNNNYTNKKNNKNNMGNHRNGKNTSIDSTNSNKSNSTNIKTKKKRVYRLVQLLNGVHDHSITGCLYDDVNSYLVTSSLDLNIKVWSAASSYSLVHTFTGHSKSVTGLLLHPHPSLIVSCSLDYTLRVWNLETLEEEYHLETTEPVLGMEVGSSSNNILVMTSKRVVAWRLHHIVTLFALCRSPVVHLAYVPTPGTISNTEGNIVARSRDHSVRLLNTTGECLCTLLPDSAVTVMTKVLYAPVSKLLLGLLGPTGDVFAYTTMKGPMALLEWRVGAKVRINHDQVNDIALCNLLLDDRHSNLSSEKTYLVGATTKGYLYVWSLNDGGQHEDRNNNEASKTRLVQPPQAVHKDSISTIIYNHASSNIICFIPSSGLLLIDQNLIPLRTLTMEKTPFYTSRKMTPTTCVQMSRKTGLLLMGLENGSFQMFDMMANNFDRNRQNKTGSYEHDAAVTSASFYVADNGAILIATGGRDGCLKFWDVKKQLLCELPLTAALNSLCFLPNGDIIFGERQHVAKVKASTYGLHSMVNNNILLRKEVLLDEGGGNNEVLQKHTNKQPENSMHVQNDNCEDEEKLNLLITTDQKVLSSLIIENECDEPNNNHKSVNVTDNINKKQLQEETMQGMQYILNGQREATRPSEPKPTRPPFRGTKLLTALNSSVDHPKGLPVGNSHYQSMIASIPPPVSRIPVHPSDDRPHRKHSMTCAKQNIGDIRNQSDIKLNKKKYKPLTRKKIPKRKYGFKSGMPVGSYENVGPQFQVTRPGAFLPAFLPFTKLPPSLRKT
jgi:WD40 repeat protein